jgi:hypothetical protein
VTGRFALFLASLAAAGCAPKKLREARRLEGRYELGEPKGPEDDGDWLRVRPGGADRAWINAALPAAIYADSNCGPRFQEGRPEKLMQQLVSGLYGVEVLRAGPWDLSGRTAEIRVQRGTLDGVPVQLGAVVINRGACTYDLVYIAPPAAFDAGWPSFERVLAGFAPEGGGLD